MISNKVFLVNLSNFTLYLIF